ncbi:hypothetical protein A7A69_14310 [Acinetobacter sp. Ac_1271]|nr:hypothetical protein [Acinetobacter guerrae]
MIANLKFRVKNNQRVNNENSTIFDQRAPLLLKKLEIAAKLVHFLLDAFYDHKIITMIAIF